VGGETIVIRHKHVREKVARGHTYYYFVLPHRTPEGKWQYIRLPDIHSADFEAELNRLKAEYPRPARRSELINYSPPQFVYFIGGGDAPPRARPTG
jgi:hypothetical protein